MTKPIRDFGALEDAARTLEPPTVAVAGAQDPDIVAAVVRLARSGIGRSLLVGDATEIEQLLARHDALGLPEIRIVPATGENDQVTLATTLVSGGEADVLLKGMVRTTTLLRAALSRDAGLREPGSLLSDVLVCPNPFRPGRPLWGITDGGVNVKPTLSQKQLVLKNGLRVMRALGHRKPRVAVLCAAETLDAAMPETIEARALAEIARQGGFGPCEIEGPLALDVAVDAAAAAHKGLDSRVAGRPDLLLAPTIEAANLLAKALYLGAHLPTAHVIAGGRVPILIGSRNDSADGRFYSILLAMIVSAGVEPSQPSAEADEPPAPTVSVSPRAERVLTVNPGATSIKIGLWEGATCLWRERIDIAEATSSRATTFGDRLAASLGAVRGLLEKRGVDTGALAAVATRGGLLQPVPAGIYRINDEMIAELREELRGRHASNLGALLAQALVTSPEVPSFVVDPVSVDEMTHVARITGWPPLRREALAHALNLRAAASRVARDLGEPLGRLRLVGLHLGGGISMAAFHRGRMIDVVNPREEGPFSADRAGALPSMGLAKLVAEERWTPAQCEARLGHEAGLRALTGTTDLREVVRWSREGDEACTNVLDALVQGIAKAAFGLLAALDDLPDRFFITGGMANEAALVERVSTRLRKVAEVVVLPGEDEDLALASAALRVLDGSELALTYSPANRDK